MTSRTYGSRARALHSASSSQRGRPPVRDSGPVTSTRNVSPMSWRNRVASSSSTRDASVTRRLPPRTSSRSATPPARTTASAPTTAHALSTHQRACTRSRGQVVLRAGPVVPGVAAEAAARLCPSSPPVPLSAMRRGGTKAIRAASSLATLPGSTYSCCDASLPRSSSRRARAVRDRRGRTRGAAPAARAGRRSPLALAGDRKSVV